MNNLLKKITDDVRVYGWHCLHVAPRVGQEGARFSYTIGLHGSYGHPEIILFGLDRKTSHGVLSECVEKIKSGSRFPVDVQIADVLAHGYNVVFKPVRKECFNEYLGTAVRHYGHDQFDAYVLFWPDKEKRFPWESTGASGQAEELRIV